MFTSDVSQSIVRVHFCSHVQNFMIFLMWLNCPTGGALAEGFQERLKEFQCFERRFEVCLCAFRKMNTLKRIFQCLLTNWVLDGCFSRYKYRIQRNVRLHGCLLRAAVSASSEITAEERRELTAKLTEIVSSFIVSRRRKEWLLYKKQNLACCISLLTFVE